MPRPLKPDGRRVDDLASSVDDTLAGLQINIYKFMEEKNTDILAYPFFFIQILAEINAARRDLAEVLEITRTARARSGGETGS